MINKLLLLTGLLAVALSVQAQENSEDVSYSETKSSKTAFHTLTFDVGPAWITSKMYTPSGKYTWRTGLELGAEYSCVFSIRTQMSILTILARLSSMQAISRRNGELWPR